MRREQIEKETYTIREAGQKLGLSKNSVYAAAHRKEIPTIRIGNRILVPKATLDKMLGQA